MYLVETGNYPDSPYFQHAFTSEAEAMRFIESIKPPHFVEAETSEKEWHSEPDSYCTKFIRLVALLDTPVEPESGYFCEK